MELKNSLLLAMEERGITPYTLIVKKLTKPVGTYTRWRNKVIGKDLASREQIEEFCQAISELCPDKPLTTDDLKFVFDRMRIV
jgi:hypothetical protein